MPQKSIDEMKKDIEALMSIQELVDAYVNVHNKFWFIEDDLYDFEKGTLEYEEVRDNVDSWGALMDVLEKRVIALAEAEGLLAERQPNSGMIKQLEGFMKKYGYRNGSGWWVKIKSE